MAASIDYSLYLILDIEHVQNWDLERLVSDICDGGVSIVQYRAKKKGNTYHRKRLENILKILSNRGIPLIVNDDPELAIQIGADGVHLGQHDMSIADARKKVGDDYIIGASARTIDKARQAVEDGADYLGVGSIYFTTTKKDIKVIGLDVLETICRKSSVPIIAIGGIDESRVEQVLSRGASGIAVISAILDSQDPGSEAKKLRERIDQFHKQAQGDLF
jgi:thiamine-phosphate pyrophosphorylase